MLWRHSNSVSNRPAEVANVDSEGFMFCVFDNDACYPEYAITYESTAGMYGLPGALANPAAMAAAMLAGYGGGAIPSSRAYVRKPAVKRAPKKRATTRKKR